MTTTTAVRHPAKFTDSILDAARDMLAVRFARFGRAATIVDPFAGVGKGVNAMRSWGYVAVGSELEREWAEQCPHVACGDFFALAAEMPGASFDGAFTSCTYGNRMADHHEARDDSRRNTYRHALGRPLSPNNSGAMQWGDDYRDFHQRAWRELFRLVRPGGWFLLNVSDHIRKGEQVAVTDWHINTCVAIGWRLDEARKVATPRQRMGANGALRVDGEWLLAFQRPA